MQQKEKSHPSYKLLVITQVQGEIEDYRELLAKDSMFDEIVSAQNKIVSSIKLINDLCMPEETLSFFRERAQSMSLDELRKSVVSYHIAGFRNLPSRPLATKEREIALALRLAKNLKTTGPKIVRTVLSATPRKEIEKYLYRYTQNGTVTMEEAEEIAQEFGLK